ncbi:hypothetical protein NMY22_g1426 [Coprinellus aureogranulatus]|nr:hypothetical protein NMY22_g1426 [Coprinellus aureogranulatus]
MQFLVYYPKTIVFLLFTLHIILRKLRDRRRHPKLPHPPGPKGYPVIGNFFDFPTRLPEQAYSRLLGQYGDMVYLESLGTKILVLGSVKRTTDLFEKRSSLYSDRHASPMLWQMGLDALLSLMPYGTRWRRQRKMFHEHFNPTVIHRYRPLMLEERFRYIQGAIEQPDAFWDLTKFYFSRIILRGAYGIEPKDNSDPFLVQARLAIEGLNEGGRTGAYLVDFIPALKYVPDWMPGTGWKRVARFFREGSLASRTAPFEHVLEAQRNGNASPSVALSLIQKLPDPDDPGYAEELLCARDTAAISFTAGADTTVGLAYVTLLLLAMHRDIQTRAQQEIDRVVGPGRLPEFEDRDDLVHILHDPNIYEDPFTFNPDRFIKDGKLNKAVFDLTQLHSGLGGGYRFTGSVLEDTSAMTHSSL